MQVANYEHDIMARTPLSGGTPLKRQDMTLPKRAVERLCREARRELEDFGLDFSQFGEPRVRLLHGISADVEWSRLDNGRTVRLTHIYFDRATGAILQAGTHYGDLEM